MHNWKCRRKLSWARESQHKDSKNFPAWQSHSLFACFYCQIATIRLHLRWRFCMCGRCVCVIAFRGGGGAVKLDSMWQHRLTSPGGGALNFFLGRGVRPGFPKCGACELTFASEKGGLWAENFQIWGLVSWKFPNLGACELKISKFGGLWAENFQIWGLVS